MWSKETPVRRSISDAVASLSSVSINDERIADVAQAWETEQFELPTWRAPVFPGEGAAGTAPEDVIDFLFVGNSINFAFRDFETGEKFVATYDGTDWHGAFGMWACLKRAYDQDIPILSGEYLSSLTDSEAESLFAPADGNQIPMLARRVEILRGIGEQLIGGYDGRFHKFLEDCPSRLFADGSGIVDRLVAEFPSFADVARIEENGEHTAVLFHKRAQLAPAMVWGRFQNRGEFGVVDPGGFTVFADYNLPNVLRHLGVLEYGASLRSRIDEGSRLVAGNRPEVEIRIATIEASDRLMEAVNRRRESPVYAPHLDYKLFSMRDAPETPVHMTRTTAY